MGAKRVNLLALFSGEKMTFAPFAVGHNVLFLPMKMKLSVASLGLFVASLLQGAAPQGSPAKSIDKMSAEELMQVLNRANLLARPYYNGVPDPTSANRGYGQKRRETRSEVLTRLSKINIPLIASNHFDGVSLQDAVPVLALLINRSHDGEPINLYVNQFLRGGRGNGVTAGAGPNAGPSNAPIVPGLGQGGGGLGMPPGGMGAGGGGDPFGGGGGDPFGGGGPGGAPGGGGPPVLNNGGQAVGALGNNFLPAGPIMPGGGGGGPLDMGSKDLGAFRPERVKVTGFSTDIANVSAMHFLEEFVTHIQKDLEITPDSPGYDYKVTNLGIAIVEASATNFKNGQRVYSRMIAVQPNLFGSQTLSPPVTGGTQQGGGQGGRPGGNMGMGGQMGGMGGMMGGPMMRYRYGGGFQRFTMPQSVQPRYRSFNFRRR